MPYRSDLIKRLATVPEAGLAIVENAIARAEAAAPPAPGSTRVVAGAIVTERPDIAWANGISPELQKDRPAESAKSGVTQR